MKFSLIKSSLFLVPLIAVAVAAAAGVGRPDIAEARAITITVEKECTGGAGVFPITLDDAQPPDRTPQTVNIGCSNSDVVTIPADNVQQFDLYETVPEGWEFVSASCELTGGGTVPGDIGIAPIPGTPAYGNAGVRITNSAVEGTVAITCTFVNSPTGIPLTIVKDCGIDEESGPFSFTGTEHLPSEDLADAAWDGLSLDCSDESTFILQPQGNYTLAETVPGDWELTDVSCETVEGLDNVVYVYEGGSPDPVTNGVRIMVPAADALDGQVVVCTFSNREYVDLTIIKDCGEDITSGPFDFAGTAHLPEADLVPADWDGLSLDCGGVSDVYKLAPAGNYTLAESVPPGWFFQGVSCVTTAGLDNTVFVYEDGSPDPVENGVRIMVPAAGAVDGQEIECTFTNTPLDPFKKYTDWQDKVVDPGEYFSWFIQVPASEEEWTVTDYLPYGFKLAGPIYAPYQGVDCITFGYTGFECTGATDSTVIIEVPVKAPKECGLYKNRATLTYEVLTLSLDGDGEHATSYVKVDDCSPSWGGPRNPRSGR